MLTHTSSVLVRASLLTALAMGVTAGCEKTSDSGVRMTVQSASDHLAGGVPETAVEKLKPIAEQSGFRTLTAKFTLGHAYLDLARDKSIELESVYVEITRLQSEVSHLVSAVSLGNTLVDGYKLQDPAAAREKIKASIAEAQGGPDKLIWINTGRSPLPTLSAARQNLSALQARVAEKQEQIRKLESNRVEAIRNTDQLAAAIDSAKGREAVDAFAKASGARKQVSTISSEIEVAQAELARLNADLSIALGQLGVIEKHIAGLQAQDKALAAGFEAITSQISSQQAVSRSTVTDTGENARSVATKSTLLSEKWAQARTLFTEAEAAYKDALAAYQSAEDEATALRAQLGLASQAYSGKSPYNEGMLKKLSELTWPPVYKIQRAYATSALADLHATWARLAAQQESLVSAAGPVFQKAAVTAPSQLAAPATSSKQARDAAMALFSESFRDLEGAASSIQGDPYKRRMSANIAQVFVLYSWAQALEAAGNGDEAAKKLDQARNLRDSIISENNNRAPVSFPGSLAYVAPAPSADTTPEAPATPNEPAMPAEPTPTPAEPTPGTPAPGR